MWPVFEQSLDPLPRTGDSSSATRPSSPTAPATRSSPRSTARWPSRSSPTSNTRRSPRTSPRPRRCSRPRPTRRCGSTPSRSWPSCAARREALQSRLEDFLLAERRGLRQHHRGNPGRHRRRRGGPVRRRPLRHVHPLRPRPGLEGRGHLLQPRRAGRLQGSRLQRHRRRRLSAPALRERRPSRPARAQDRDAGPHPHLGRDRGRAARAGRGAGRDPATRTSNGRRCGPAAPAASTSTRPRAPSASGTRRARRTRWKSSARTSAASTRTTTGPCASCAAGCTSGSSRSCTSERAEQRRTLIGSGDRSERIRTYNFPQNRLTDHRINLTLYKLDAIIAGELGELIQALQRLRQEAAARRTRRAGRTREDAMRKAPRCDGDAMERGSCRGTQPNPGPSAVCSTGRRSYLAEKGCRDRRAWTPRCCWPTPWLQAHRAVHAPRRASRRRNSGAKFQELVQQAGRRAVRSPIWSAARSSSRWSSRSAAPC